MKSSQLAKCSLYSINKIRSDGCIFVVISKVKLLFYLQKCYYSNFFLFINVCNFTTEMNMQHKYTWLGSHGSHWIECSDKVGLLRSV